MLETCARAGCHRDPVTWVGEEFLAEHRVEAWTDMPLFVPDSDEDLRGMLSVSIAKAKAAGLTLRQLRDTVQDTLAWERGHPWRAGLSLERERELRRTWHGR